MKRVSFKVAKAIKAAGYPQELDVEHLVINKKGYTGTYDEFDYDEDLYACPTYFEVWLWLWQEKRISIDVIRYRKDYWKNNTTAQYFDNQEEAIEAAIEYLVEDDLIK